MVQWFAPPRFQIVVKKLNDLTEKVLDSYDRRRESSCKEQQNTVLQA